MGNTKAAAGSERTLGREKKLFHFNLLLLGENGDWLVGFFFFTFLVWR